MTIETYRGQRPQLGKQVYIHPSAVVVGQVWLGDQASVWPQVAARGDVHEIHIGARSNIQDNTVLHVTHAGPYTGEGFPLHIGEDVTVGHSAVLHACTVGDRCLIGMGAIVLDGAIIEPDSMIAAGALVPPGKRVRSGTLWVGNPAREARKLSDEEIERLKYSADHYVKLAAAYLAES